MAVFVTEIAEFFRSLIMFCILHWHRISFHIMFSGIFSHYIFVSLCLLGDLLGCYFVVRGNV